MKCKVCSHEIQQGALFCSQCGMPLDGKEAIKKISLKCEQCGGVLTVEADKTVLSCPYCENKTLIVESDIVAIERIKATTHKDIELEKIKSQDKRYEREKEKRERKAQAEEFRYSIWGRFLLIAFVIAGFLTYFYFTFGRILAGILSVIQTICFGIAWCNGIGIIKEKRRYIHILWAVIGLFLVLPTIKWGGLLDKAVDENSLNNRNEIEEIQWSILEMGDIIPETVSKKIDIVYSNDAEWLNIHVYNMLESDYYAYIQQCEKEYGFNIDVEKIGSSFWAYNEKGYRLRVSYLSDYMAIDLKCPTEFGEYIIPEYAIKQGIPSPKSELGYYKWEYDDNFNLWIGNTTYEEYREYVELCVEAGFTENSQDGKEFYNGDNKKGYELSLDYLGYNIMAISFKCPEGFDLFVGGIYLNDTEAQGANVETSEESETIKEHEKIEQVMSEYEKAYIRKMSNYSLYMMFDEDKKEVIYFGTNDNGVSRGVYSGIYEDGLTISWEDGWDEKFIHSSGNVATLIDGNGYDWKYEVCDVVNAQKVLDKVK